MKKQKFKKNEERLRNLQDNFKCSNIQIIGVPEEEEEEQQIENLFEQIMKKNFPNLAKEIDFQEVQEAQSPKEVGPKEHTPRHVIITLLKIKDKERILKQQEKRRQLPTKEFPEDCQLTSQKIPYRQEGARKKYSKLWKITSKITVSSKAIT